jgi:hypothetical protein
MDIRALSKQEYEKDSKSPCEIIFYETEKDILRIVSTYFAENIEENVEALQKFLLLPSMSEVYRTQNVEKVLYIIKYNSEYSK